MPCTKNEDDDFAEALEEGRVRDGVQVNQPDAGRPKRDPSRQVEH